jgi:DNA-binding helix-hairpin-helix protein with protein kinase domain
MRQIYDSKGQRVATGALLGKGGEGSVFEVCDRQGLVAKIYERGVAPEHSAKLATMVGLGAERLLRLAAWPIDTLHERPNGPIIGLLMPHAVGKPVFKLYGPKSRLAEFPSADWRFLVFAACNIARAFHVVHEHGHVIGDVNHGNLFITPQATAVLIDCDSFQISLPNRRFICGVGMETYTPPELQCAHFAKVVRTPNHDNFGLAVLIFQLLFMGRHPFSGAYQGKGEMPISTAIKEFRFAYGPNAATRQMRPPPATLTLEAASPTVAGLFERAFGQSGIASQGRPLAQDWVNALDQLSRSLIPCVRHSGHYYWRMLTTCPWCNIEGKVGILLFNYSPRAQAQHSAFDVAAVWNRILQVVAPGPPPPLPTRSSFTVTPSPQAIQLRQHYRQGIAMVATILGMNKQRDQAIATLRAAGQNAQSRHSDLVRRWRKEASEQEFLAKRQLLEKIHSDYLNLPNLYAQQLKDLEQNREAHQRRRYLESIRLGSVTIPGIGQGRKATLQSYGIETANDVAEAAIRAVPGFGPALTRKLLTWRQSIEPGFRFDPKRSVDPVDRRALEMKLQQTRFRLEDELSRGAAELEAIGRQIQQRRTTLLKSIRDALIAEAQAEADLNAL